MKNLQEELIKSSASGYFTVYHININDLTHSEVIVIDDDFLEETDGPMFSAFDIFHEVKKHLVPGTYFSVYKNGFGSDWFTTVVPTEDERKKLEEEQKKIDKIEKRKKILSDICSWFSKRIDTILILMTIVLCALWIKS